MESGVACGSGPRAPPQLIHFMFNDFSFCNLFFGVFWKRVYNYINHDT